MQIAFGRVRRKTSPARREVPKPLCSHIFGLYYKRKSDVGNRSSLLHSKNREHSSVLQKNSRESEFPPTEE